MIKKSILFLALFVGLSAKTLQGGLQPYLLPQDHPLQKKLQTLFTNSEMFNSQENLRAAGFKVFKRAHRGLMVAKHPSCKHYLFKKFTNKTNQEEQLKNYLRRITGARALSQFIREKNLQFIVTPQKWLYPLPPEKFRKTFILIVEEIDICTKAESKERYGSIAPRVLQELCQVLRKFRGLDSVIPNLPFTHQGKIAFIDTERWESQRPIFLRKVMPILNKRSKAIVQQLEKP